MIVMALIIALLGAILFVAERVARHVRGMKDLTLKDSIVIGLAQAFGAPEEGGSALMCTTLRCHPRKRLEQPLESGSIVKGMLGGGTLTSLRFAECSFALAPVGL